MKYIKKYFESREDIESEILENFLFFSDEFGQPIVNSKRFGNSFQWFLSFNIKSELISYQSAEKFTQTIDKLSKYSQDILDAQSRLSNFEIDVHIDIVKVNFKLTPKDTGADSYRFVIRNDEDGLVIDTGEIERFLLKYDVKIKKIINEYDEEGGRNIVTMMLSSKVGKNDEAYKIKKMINNEIKNKKTKFSNNYEAYINSYPVFTELVIEPGSENAYIDFQ